MDRYGEADHVSNDPNEADEIFLTSSVYPIVDTDIPYYHFLYI